MKNQKTKLLAITLSASFVLSSMAPALASANSMDLAASSTYTQLDPEAINPEVITDLISKAEDLKKLLHYLPNAKVYERALDIIINVLKKIDPAKAANKVKLASESIDAIKFSIEDIQGKTKKAHVDIGLEITKAALVVANPNASNARVEKASENLKLAIEKAKNSKDITDNDVATIYVKKELNNTIEEARKLRRNKDLSKEEKEAITKAIREAEHSKNKIKVTVGEIKAANAKLKEFLASFVSEEEEIDEEIQTPEFPENPEEEVEEPEDEIVNSEEETEEPEDEIVDPEEETEESEDEIIDPEEIDPEFSQVEIEEVEISENN